MPPQASTPPDLDLPASKGHVVRVSIMNGSVGQMPVGVLLGGPIIKGHENIRLSNYSFLVESENRQQKVLFDLAMMKNVDEKMPPALKALFANGPGEVKVDTDISSILSEHGMSLSSIDAIIWSHSHIDHVGDPSLFPTSVELVVGPGFKDECMPGYPIDPNSFVLSSAFEGRSVREVDFSKSNLTIGSLRAIDYFDDGSFYLLHAPGHTAHHLCALARTTPETFVLLAGDSCYHMGQLRPSSHLPLPENIHASSLPANLSEHVTGCLSCARYQQLLPDSKAQGPYYGLNPHINASVPQAQETLDKVRVFDASDNVLVVIAHDPSLLDTVNMYPKTVNDWKQHKWDEKVRWRFLSDFKDSK